MKDTHANIDSHCNLFRKNLDHYFPPVSETQPLSSPNANQFNVINSYQLEKDEIIETIVILH